MGIVVQKFGGRFLQTVAGRKKALHLLKEAVANGDKVLAVVSAFGRKGACYATDTFIKFGSHLSPKEQDRLVSMGEVIATLRMADIARQEKINCYALSPHESGIITNNHFGNADIVRINPSLMFHFLEYFDVLFVPGFQGNTNFGDITTLGRGGSDLTAVALASACSLHEATLFKEVNGVMSADPELVPDAVNIPKLSFHSLRLLTQCGAKVVQQKAAVLAELKQIQLHILSGDSMQCGTLICDTKYEDPWFALTSTDRSIYVLGSNQVQLLSKVHQALPNLALNVTNDWIELPMESQNPILLLPLIHQACQA